MAILMGALIKETVELPAERPAGKNREQYWNPFQENADGDCVLSSRVDVSEKEHIRIEAALGILRLHVRETFSQVFSLPVNSDIDAIRADYRDGLLTVRVPCRQEAPLRIIPIG